MTPNNHAVIPQQPHGRSLTVAAALQGRAAPFVQAARAENTRKAYQKAWTAFCAFCAAQGARSRPADVITVADYLTRLAEAGRRPSTIDQATAAISAAHRLGDSLDPTQNQAIRVLLAGIRRRLSTAPAQKAAATRGELQRMVNALPTNLAGVRDRALLLLGYACASRRSELVSLDVEDLHFGEHGLTVHLRRSKTDPEGAGTLQHVPVLRKADLCAVRAVRAWLNAAGLQRGPLFRKVDRWGHVQPGRLNDRAVALVIKRAAASAGLDARQFSGHSLRAGFATQAAADGVDSLAIREVTRHKSDRMLSRYVRSGGAQARRAVRRALGEG